MQFKERCTLVEDSTKLAWSYGKVDKECKKQKNEKHSQKAIKIALGYDEAEKNDFKSN